MNKVSKEILYELYAIRGKPMHEIAKELDIAVGSVYNYMKQYGIDSRTAKESFKLLKDNGWEYPKSAKEKISKAHKGKIVSEETRRKMSEEQKTNGAHRQRKKHTEQSKKKMSESHKGLQIGENHPFSKKVRCIETGEVFESMSLAAKAKGNQSASPHIGSCCRGERKICLGFHWEFV